MNEIYTTLQLEVKENIIFSLLSPQDPKHSTKDNVHRYPDKGSCLEGLGPFIFMFAGKGLVHCSCSWVSAWGWFQDPQGSQVNGSSNPLYKVTRYCTETGTHPSVHFKSCLIYL